MTAETAADAAVPYKDEAGTATGQVLTAAQAEAEMLRRGALRSALPDGWVANHFRWIVWKLACEERRASHFVRSRAKEIPTTDSRSFVGCGV